MNIGSDQVLVNAEDKVETAGEEKRELDAALVELGKVSETKGGWVGVKADSGAGLMPY
jgi:hypothetical protein